jgi:flagellar biosynthesis GTPase FlhF
VRRSLVWLLVSTVSTVAWAQRTPCEVPRIRDLAALQAAIVQDKAMSQAFLKASQACQMAESDSCDAARLECGNQLASTLKAQVGFDDGAWLRDMLLPYGGLSYPPTRQFQAGAMAMDTACSGDSSQLLSASSRRSLQAVRRQAIIDEYPRYTLWVQDQAKACRDRAGLDETRRDQERAEAEKLAALALASKGAEELRQAREAEARRKAEDEKKAQAEAQRVAQAEKEAAEKKAREERKSAEENAAIAQRDANAEAQRQALEAEEVRVVTTREERKLAFRTQKKKLIAQAEEADKRVAEIAAMTFTAEQASLAAQRNAEKLQAAERSKTLRAQVADIVIDDDDERPHGSLGVMGGVGAATWSTTTSPVLGAQALFHVGLWRTAPAQGLASGFEARVLGRYLSALGTGSVQQAEGVASARYFFGRIGLGAALELRWNKPLMDVSVVNIAFGPAIGIALVDTPKTRVILNASWLPLTQRGFQNPYRTTGDFEISYTFLTFSIAGGLQTQSVGPSEPFVAWYVGAFAGARLRW